jgi:O-antigen ligase
VAEIIFFKSLWSVWKKSDVIHLLFGYGFVAPLKFVGLSAHNDWLELLTTAGILGVYYLLIFFIQTFQIARNSNWISSTR